MGNAYDTNERIFRACQEVAAERSGFITAKSVAVKTGLSLSRVFRGLSALSPGRVHQRYRMGPYYLTVRVK